MEPSSVIFGNTLVFPMLTGRTPHSFSVIHPSHPGGLVEALSQSRVKFVGAGQLSIEDGCGHCYVYLAIQMNVLIRYGQCYVYFEIQMIVVLFSQSGVGYGVPNSGR